jgi:hypothetical protein
MYVEGPYQRLIGPSNHPQRAYTHIISDFVRDYRPLCVYILVLWRVLDVREMCAHEQYHAPK